MSRSPIQSPLKLDPWVASSLLQKAIRRGEVELAQHAAQILHRFRGKAIWRRPINIAVEDVGIAELDLVWEVTRLATDKQLREVLGSDNELLRTVCAKLALAPKDRSADYVYCAATRLPAAFEEHEQLRAAPRHQLLSIAATVSEPLMKRMSAAMLACTVAGQGEAMSQAGVRGLLAALPCECPSSLEQTILTLAEQRAHPYSLGLVLLWSQYQWTGGAHALAAEAVPEADYIGGIPLYVFEKHTSVGKRALAMLPICCGEVRDVLRQWVPKLHHADVARMSGFYADGAPIAQRLEWFGGRHLEFIGMHADMMSVGCSFEAVAPVLKCVRENLPKINDLRRSILLGIGPRGTR